MQDVTLILRAIDRGDAAAAASLLPHVYDELRRLAARHLADERPGHTLQPTALVHEAYVRLVGHQPAARWDGRGHFFAAAAEAMRRILVDGARRKRAVRHGGGRQRVPLDDALAGAAAAPVPAVASPADADELIALSEAMDRLAAEDPAKAELVKLHYFAGLTLAEAGEVLGLSRATAYRHWTYARAWLRDAVRGGPPADPPDHRP